MKKKNIITGIIGGLVAVAASIFLIRRNKKEEHPPKDAPQLHLENPGDQSEFTPSPSGERDLG